MKGTWEMYLATLGRPEWWNGPSYRMVSYTKSLSTWKFIFSDFISAGKALFHSILIPDIISVRPEGIHARDDYTCCALVTSYPLWSELQCALEGVSPLLIPFGRSALQSRTQKLWLESVDFVTVLCCVLIISLFVGAMRRGRLSWNEFSGFEMMSEITEPWWREKDVVAAPLAPDAGEEAKKGAQERQIVPAGAERVIQDFPSSSLADPALSYRAPYWLRRTSRNRVIEPTLMWKLLWAIRQNESGLFLLFLSERKANFRMIPRALRGSGSVNNCVCMCLYMYKAETDNKRTAI